MSKSNHSKRLNGRPTVPEQPDRGFTLTELLVVIAILAMLAATLLPALAGTKRNPNRIQCLSNLHQLYAACVMYSSDFNNWYPVWDDPDGSHPVNVLKGENYTRYVFGPNGDPGKQIPQIYILNGAWVSGFTPGSSRELGPKPGLFICRRFYRRRESHVVSGLLQFDRHNQCLKLAGIFLPGIYKYGF